MFPRPVDIATLGFSAVRGVKDVQLVTPKKFSVFYSPNWNWGISKQNIIFPDSRDEFERVGGHLPSFFPSFLPSLLHIRSHEVETLEASVIGSKQAPPSQFILISH